MGTTFASNNDLLFRAMTACDEAQRLIGEATELVEIAKGWAQSMDDRRRREAQRCKQFELRH